MRLFCGLPSVFAVVLFTAPLHAAAVNPWLTSDAKVSADQPMPDIFSIEAFHRSAAFMDLKPKEFCRKLFDLYYDGRRKNWNDFLVGMTLWAHTPQEPHASDNVIELDPVVLLNVHGTGYCGIQSGLLEGIYQSGPGGEIGKPAIDARRWFLGGTVHSVCDAFYDGKWHYYDVDLGGFGGDDSKDVWSVADVIANPDGYFGAATTLKSKYFFKADGDGKWVKTIDKTKSYCFQENHMLGHEMTFTLRKGESFTRFFSGADAGWKETLPFTKAIDEKQKGYCELIYHPDPAETKNDALSVQDGAAVYAVRCPYNISSSRVETGGKASVSFDLGQNWTALSADGIVAGAANRWDYLLKIEGGELIRVTTRGLLHPGSLPRIGAAATTMTLAKAAPYESLTYIPDWSSAEKLAACCSVEGLKYGPSQMLTFTGGALGGGKGAVTVPVKAPPGTKIVKLGACAIGGGPVAAAPENFIELFIGPTGQAKLAGRTTDCSAWDNDPATHVEHWQNNVNGSAEFEPYAAAEVKVKVNGYGSVQGIRVYAGYVRSSPVAASGTLVVTHGYDGKKFSKEIPVGDLDKAPVSYKVPDGAKANNFVKMEVK